MQTLDVKTHAHSEFVEITDSVRTMVRNSGVERGMCLVYCPHTTAAVTINENADPDVVHDMLGWFHRAIPHRHEDYRHGEGNSDAHIKASLVGASALLVVEKGDLVLGRWQGVYFCEFDGPRSRHVHVQVMSRA